MSSISVPLGPTSKWLFVHILSAVLLFLFVIDLVVATVELGVLVRLRSYPCLLVCITEVVGL